MIPPAWTLILGGGTLGTFATSSVLNIVPVSLGVAALLALLPERDSAPKIVPSDAGKLLAETTVK